MFQGLISFLNQCKRVWHILKKPDMKEFSSISKISAIGVLALGLMGFIISVVIQIIKQPVR